MGYGNPKNLKYLSFTLKNQKKDAEEAYIEVYDYKTKSVIDKVSWVRGELVGIKFGTGEYNNKKFPTVRITLKDGEEAYIVRSGSDRLTGTMRDILNKFLTATSFDDIYISFFGKAGEYKNISVKANDIKLEYMFNKEDKAQFVDIVKYQGEDLKDYSRFDEHIIKAVTEMIIPQLKHIEENTPSHAPENDADFDNTTQPSQEPAPSSQDNPEPVTDDDFPF